MDDGSIAELIFFAIILFFMAIKAVVEKFIASYKGADRSVRDRIEKMEREWDEESDSLETLVVQESETADPYSPKERWKKRRQSVQSERTRLERVPQRRQSLRVPERSDPAAYREVQVKQTKAKRLAGNIEVDPDMNSIRNDRGVAEHVQQHVSRHVQEHIHNSVRDNIGRSVRVSLEEHIAPSTSPRRSRSKPRKRSAQRDVRRVAPESTSSSPLIPGGVGINPLQQALLHAEILGPPRSLKRWQSRRMSS
ncbi:MAG: hypothetical protein QF752_15555 [Planctomycetota bacterium]|jgi:hypothetical protein|nr:hypothetical protein [Planctomycetota bacterium]